MKKSQKFILGMGIGATIAGGAMLMAHYFKKRRENNQQAETTVNTCNPYDLPIVDVDAETTVKPCNPYDLPIVDVDAECCVSEKMAFASLNMIDTTGKQMMRNYKNPSDFGSYINYLNEYNGLNLSGDSIFCTCAFNSESIDNDSLEESKIYGFINEKRIAMRVEHMRYPIVMPIDLLRNAEEGQTITIYLPGVYKPDGGEFSREEIYGEDFNRCIIKLNMHINQHRYDMYNMDYNKTMKDVLRTREMKFFSDQAWCKRRAAERNAE